MKIKVLKPANIEGLDRRAGDEVQVKPEDARALVKMGFAEIVKERAVLTPNMETRG